MNSQDKTMENIISFINSIPFEPEKYDQEKKRKYFNNLNYYEIDFDVDKLNKSVLKDVYLRFLDQKIKEKIKFNIIQNLNIFYEYVGFQKRFENLPTQADYNNLSHFSRFLNMYDLGFENSEDNTHRFVLQEIVNLIRYLHPFKTNIYNNELISMFTLSLNKEDFNSIIDILKEFKEESDILRKYKNWAEIYHSNN